MPYIVKIIRKEQNDRGDGMRDNVIYEQEFENVNVGEVATYLNKPRDGKESDPESMKMAGTGDAGGGATSQ